MPLRADTGPQAGSIRQAHHADMLSLRNTLNLRHRHGSRFAGMLVMLTYKPES